jgi:lysophospholipase L1-like esterase
MNTLKILLNILFFIFLVSSTVAQPPDLKTILEKNKKSYLDKINQFDEENKKLEPNKKYVVLLGNSLTQGFNIEQYFKGKPVLNRGISGDTIGTVQDDYRGLLKRLDSSCFNCQPSHIFILIGVNDINDGRPIDELIQGYKELLEKIKQGCPDTKIFVQSALPARDKYAKLNDKIIDYNNKLKKLAEEMKVEYIDLHSLMKDEKGELKAEFTGDGIHIKEPAYQIWKKEILKRVDFK